MVSDMQEQDNQKTKNKFSFYLKNFLDKRRERQDLKQIKKLEKIVDEIQYCRKGDPTISSTYIDSSGKSLPLVNNLIGVPYSSLDNQALADMKTRFEQELKNGKTLEELLPDAYAVVLEVVSRTKKDNKGNPIELTNSQIMTSLVLNDGNIAELATGEGKTFALTMAAYLNSLGGEQVHIFTANDYLAQRDAEQNTPIYEALGLKVGYALNSYTENGKPLKYSESKKIRKQVYSECDIVYARSSTIAFDWEADHQVMKKEDRVLTKDFNYAIVDEVDSVLIDDANTPLVLSRNMEKFSKELRSFEDIELDGSLKIVTPEHQGKWVTEANSFVKNIILKDKKNIYPINEEFVSGFGKILQGDRSFNAIMQKIENSDALVYHDLRYKSVSLTSKGQDLVMKHFKKYADALQIPENEIFDYIQKALEANLIQRKNVDYRVTEVNGSKKIILLDASTGRDLPDNKYSQGLHQAIEAKEGIEFSRRTKQNVSTAKITHPAFFHKYKKFAGTSGTVSDEVTKFEFLNQYDKKITKIPRSRKKIAVENPIEVYKTEKEKIDAIVNQIIECHSRKQPILVGARDIEEAQKIMKKLDEFAAKPFNEICAEVFKVDKDKVRVMQATKLYCLMTGIEYPTDRRSRASLARKVVSLILPEHEKTPLDRRVQKGLEAKLRNAPEMSVETKNKLFEIVNNRQATSKEELESFAIKLRGLTYQSLTAADTDREVEIISQAGRLGAITISTAIAGRGTDIALGGNPKELAKIETEKYFVDKIGNVDADTFEKEQTKITRQVELLSRSGKCDDIRITNKYNDSLIKWQNICKEEEAILSPSKFDDDKNPVHETGKGLFVLGASLNNSIRVDNQLRGRCGRQGSDGESKFMCSLEDELIKTRAKSEQYKYFVQAFKEGNVSQKLAVDFVRSTQRSYESARASARNDANKCARGFDWFSNAYYTYREQLLDNPTTVISGTIKEADNLLFSLEDEAYKKVLTDFVPSLFSTEEVQNLGKEELKILYQQRTSEMIEALNNSQSEKVIEALQQKLLTLGDLSFTDTINSNAIENDYRLRSLGDRSTDSDLLLDQTVFDQYNYFRTDLLVRSSISAVKLLKNSLNLDFNNTYITTEIENKSR